MEIESLVAELVRADRTAVQKAVTAVASLRSARPCLDEGMLLRQPTPPLQGREAIRDVRAMLWRADSLALAGNYEKALAVATQAREQAATLDWPALLPSSLAPVSTYPHNIVTEFGKPAWGNDFNQQITWLATQKHQIAELHLHPAALGPVEIILHISNDQSTQVSAQFTSPHLAVREAIESALPRLREMMAESGITLGNTTVGVETSQQHPNHQRDSRTSGANVNNATITKIQGLPNELDRSARSMRQGIINTFA